MDCFLLFFFLVLLTFPSILNRRGSFLVFLYFAFDIVSFWMFIEALCRPFVFSFHERERQSLGN